MRCIHVPNDAIGMRPTAPAKRFSPKGGRMSKTYIVTYFQNHGSCLVEWIGFPLQQLPVLISSYHPSIPHCESGIVPHLGGIQRGSDIVCEIPTTSDGVVSQLWLTKPVCWSLYSYWLRQYYYQIIPGKQRVQLIFNISKYSKGELLHSQSANQGLN